MRTRETLAIESLRRNGGLGATTTILFFMYIVGSLAVAAPVLNSSLQHELRQQGNKARDDGTTSPAEASPG